MCRGQRARRVAMFRTVKNLLCFSLVMLVAYVLLVIGEFRGSGVSPTSYSTNAFLFLMGLGGVITLLSPPLSSRLRPRW